MEKQQWFSQDERCYIIPGLFHGAHVPSLGMAVNLGGVKLQVLSENSHLLGMCLTVFQNRRVELKSRFFKMLVYTEFIEKDRYTSS